LRRAALILLLMLVLASLLYADGDDFNITVSVPVVGFECQTIEGAPYRDWRIEAFVWDTVAMKPPDFMLFVNGSNIPVSILASVEDVTEDTSVTRWTPSVVQGIERFVLQLTTSYILLPPDFSDYIVLLDEPVEVIDFFEVGSSVYLVFRFLAPSRTSPGTVHRLSVTLTVTPS